MFEVGAVAIPEATPVDTPALTAERVSDWIDALAGGGLPESDAARIDLITALERVIAAAQSAQARTTVAFDTSQRQVQAAAEVPKRRHTRSITSQIALARHVSPHQGAQLHGLAMVLDRELPCTAAAFRQGRISQWRAQIIARETAALSVEDRGEVDRQVASNVAELERRGDRELAGLCAGHAARLDPASVVARRRKAEQDRTVSLRPAPDTMAYLTGLLPVGDGVAVFTALNQAADSARAQGDDRNRGQVMADTLVARITGAAANTTGGTPAGSTAFGNTAGSADAGKAGSSGSGITWAECDLSNQAPPARATHATPASAWTTPTGTGAADPDPDTDGAPDPADLHTDAAPAPARPGIADPDAADPAGAAGARPAARPGLMLNLVMTDQQLFGSDDRPAWLDGYGPIDADLARELAARHQTWIRRLFTDPAGTSLIAMESGSRYFPDGLKTLIRLRDQHCRTPWCDAPIRHTDHLAPVGTGGPTSYGNGQGLCEACNYAKQSAYWRAKFTEHIHQPPGTGPIDTTTPAGHHYHSPEPIQPCLQRPRPPDDALVIDINYPQRTRRRPHAA